ncbi:hypothetical protein SLEP1_g60165 [Rubroshorea leprosula]|uniref:Uncharacterized protein n=1 Tax=Rubroshorea leprosula TaxID=152421 RepID=A0AAV5MXR7_9ROSI|nr:hypothetical protein SLEP1_g60165 [Rubroshorea leprosula]
MVCRGVSTSLVPVVFCPIRGIWGRGYERGWVLRNGRGLEAERGKKKCRISGFEVKRGEGFQNIKGA